MDISLPDQRIRSVAADEDNLFPALKQWRDKKLADLSYCLAIFFNYLAEPREEGFRPVSTDPTNTMAVHPVVTQEMTSYLVGEIFPCPSMLKDDRFTVFRVPADLSHEIEAAIRKAITDRSLLTPIKHVVMEHGHEKTVAVFFSLRPGVTQTLWTYLSNGIDALAYDSASNEQVVEKITSAEKATLDKRNSRLNYGFNDDAENCAFQTILYIIVALVDWLEVSKVGKSEVITAYKIIVPPDLQKSLAQTKNDRFTEIIVESFVSKDLIPNDEAVGLISTMMVDFGYHMNNLKDKNSERIMSRYMGLSQPI